MKIVTTPAELMDRLRWDEACEILGLSVWAVNEGQMDSGEEITLTEEQAVQLGLSPAQPDRSAPKTCAHCGRECGDYAGGGATVDGQSVCHPNERGRPDCYRLIVDYGERLGARR